MIAPGTVVGYGFSYERGRVIEFQRRYGIGGYRVQDALPPGDYGALRANPRWIPVSELRCANCEHGIEQFHRPDGCWFSVAVGTEGADKVCPCAWGGGQRAVARPE